MSEQKKNSDVGLIVLVALVLGGLLLAGGGGVLIHRQKAQRRAAENARMMEETLRIVEAEMNARHASTLPSDKTPK